jgi:hypothetical protein
MHCVSRKCLVFVLLIIDISKNGAKEMGHVKMAGPSFVNDAYSMMTQFGVGVTLIVILRHLIAYFSIKIR